MRILEYAAAIEQQAALLIEQISVGVPQLALEITTVLQKHQHEVIYTLLPIAVSSYAKIEAHIFIDDDAWQKITSAVSSRPQDLVSWQSALWAIQELYDRLFQFYSQASKNTPLPEEKLFLSSLAEIKNIMRRRIEAVIRIISNEVWGQLGFAPFALGKE